MTDHLGAMMRRQSAYMLEMLDGCPPADLPLEMRADFVRAQSIGLIAELVEALDEFRWKPWGNHEGEFVDRNAFVGELRDAMQFLMNLMAVADVTAAELDSSHEAKIRVNLARLRHPEGDDTVARVVDGRSIDDV